MEAEDVGGANVTFCKACGKVVEWHPTAGGSSMPIDPDPSPDGNFAWDGRLRLIRVVPGTRPRAYRCHWDTCAKGAKPERQTTCERDETFSVRTEADPPTRSVMKPFYLHRVTETEAASWVAVGWREVSRDRVPSVAEVIVVLRWDGDGKAPRP